MKHLLFVVSTIFLISCGVSRTKDAEHNMSGGDSLEKNDDSRILLNDNWVVVSINGSAICLDPETDGIEAPTMEINLDNMQYMGSDGCNRFTGGISSLEEKSISFGIAAGTRRMCQDMLIPDQFNSALPLITSYKYEGMTLSLFDEKGHELIQLKKVD